MKEKRRTAKPDSARTGERFQKLRLRAGLSQESAAEELSCSSRTIQRYEAGDTTPDYTTLRRMIDSYKCEAADLFGQLPSGEETGGDI